MRNGDSRQHHGQAAASDRKRERQRAKSRALAAEAAASGKTLQQLRQERFDEVAPLKDVKPVVFRGGAPSETEQRHDETPSWGVRRGWRPLF